MIHFENIWEEAEVLLKDDTAVSTLESLSKELSAKISIYEKIDSMAGMSPEDKERLKTNAMGKILLVLTQFSQKDNINVYAALKAAVDSRKISIFEEKYK